MSAGSIETLDDAHLPVTQIYVYPTLDATTGELVTAQNLTVDPAVQLLYNYILQRGTLIPIENYNRWAPTDDAVSECMDDAGGKRCVGHIHIYSQHLRNEKAIERYTQHIAN